MRSPRPPGSIDIEPSQELIDSIYREKVLRARSMSPEQRASLGPSLFAMACELSKSGIRSQHPEADEAEVLRLLRHRLDIKRRLEGPRPPGVPV